MILNMNWGQGHRRVVLEHVMEEVEGAKDKCS